MFSQYFPVDHDEYVWIEGAQLQPRAGVYEIRVAEELREAQTMLSTITGEFTADQLLGEIFGRFCIGK